MKQEFVWACLCALVGGGLLLSGCGDSDDDGTPAAVTFTEVNEMVLQPSCALSSSCHQGTNASVPLNLQVDPYNALVGATAEGPMAAAAGRVLVVPGDPDGSYLMEKLTSATPLEGVRMPYGGQELDANRLALVRGWIAAGAPND